MVRTFLFFKATSLIVLLFAMVVFLPMDTFAESDPVEQFREKYLSILEKAQTEKSSPAKQRQMGIRMADILCFDNKIPILKWASNDFVACVTPQTSDILSERDWGISKSPSFSMNDSIHPGMCFTQWKLYNTDIQSQKQVIMEFRKAIFAVSEQDAWKPITINMQPNNITEVLSGGKFTDEQSSQILEILEKHTWNQDAEHVIAACN